MRWLTYLAVFLILLGFGWLTASSLSWAGRLKIPAEAAAGKRVWQRYGCVECHMIFGNGDYSSLDLTRISRERDSQWLKDYLTSAPLFPEAKNSRHPAVTGEEAKLLLAFFDFISQVDTGAWPPKPLSLRPGDPAGKGKTRAR